MLKGFKEFLLRGNVVELATAVIIGAAFTAIVTAFTEKIINPLLAAIPSGQDCGQEMTTGTDSTAKGAVQVCGLGYQLLDDNSATFMDFGFLIAAIINFVIVAAVVYFIIVVPYNKLSELRAPTADEAAETEVAVLTEIRDLLAAQRVQAAPAPAGGFATPAPAPSDYLGPDDGPRHSR